MPRSTLLRRLKLWLLWLVGVDVVPPERPFIVGIWPTGETFMAMRFILTLSAPAASDVAKRELQVAKVAPVTDPGADPVPFSFDDPAVGAMTVSLPAEQVAVPVEAERDFVVHARLRDIDGSGNASAWSATTVFTAVDVFPPPAPSILQVTPDGQTS